MYKKHGWSVIDKGKPKYSEKNTHICQFLDHKSYMDKHGIENWVLAVTGWQLTACAVGRRSYFVIDNELNLSSLFCLIGLLLRLDIVKNIVLIRERCNTSKEYYSLDDFMLQKNYFTYIYV